MDGISDMRARHERVKEICETSTMHYADGVQAVLDRGELLNEVARLQQGAAMTDLEMIAHLLRKGYIVRGPTDLKGLSWNRLDAGDEFEQEAVAKIREQIGPEHLTFFDRKTELGGTIRTAVLYLG